MATYNRRNIISEAVESILNQTFTDFELIIIDDCSHDETWVTLEGLASLDKRIRLAQTTRNSGCNIARNVGIDLSRGKYIAIADDDDLAKYNRLELQVKYLEEHKEFGLAGSTVQPISKRGKIASPYPDSLVTNSFPDNPSKVFEDLYLGKYVIPNPALMFRSIVLKKCKYPAVNYNGADVTLTLQLAALGVRMAIIPEPLVMMRQGTDHIQMTSDLNRVHLGRKRRIRDISEWLRGHHIHSFDHLYKQALINVKVKQCIEKSLRTNGLSRCFYYLNAFWLSPKYCLLFTYSIILRRFS